MKNKYGKRIIALFLALALGSSAFSGMTFPVSAQTTDEGGSQAEAKSSSSYEPWEHGYRFVDVLNFDPATDNYSKELRARVPLQERNEAFAATQANPNLTTDAQLYVISSGDYRSTDVSEAPWNGNQSYDDFSYNAYKFWQYTDLIGAGGRPTSGIDVGSVDKEYGTTTIPTVATINAAHKNGVMALGEYFVPRTPLYTEEWLYKDENGNFPYAQKLIDIMNYYGFDGYFINQEENIDSSYVPLFREMLKWMRDQGCYIQWYDSITDSGYISYQNNFNSTNSNWIWNETNGRVTDSIFLNYWNNPGSMQSSADHAISLGLDPHEVVYYGVEGGQWRWSKDLDGLRDETGNSILSFAIWGSHFYREQYGRDGNKRYQAAYQWQNEERERMYFTAPSEYVNDYSSVDRPDVEVTDTAFKGFSRYIAERSVINGTTFNTDFNNGHGMQYFENGEVSRDMEWTNINLQDILPTWQWWVETTDDNLLNMDWDYGPKQEKMMSDGSMSTFDFEQVGAYNGGSSLAVYGAVQGSQFVNLYKTDLDVTADSSISFTYNKPSADDSSAMQLGLIFKDRPEEKVLLPIEESGKQTDGWKTVDFSLAEYAGREIAAIGLEISASEKVDAYQVNLGGLKVSDGKTYTPDAPTGLVLDREFDSTGEIQLSWDINENYDEVQLYRIYAEYADGSERFVGGAYTDNYYIENLENPEEITALKLYAVGPDGSMSDAASVPMNTGMQVSDIKAASGDNQLTVTWADSDEEYQNVKVELSYWYSEKENPEAITVEKGIGEAVFDIPLEDGSEYILTLTTINADGSENAPVDYFGELADNYCEPFEGEFRHEGSTDDYILTTPPAEDWAVMNVEINGSTTEYKRIGGQSPVGIEIEKTGLQYAVVTLEDRNGNQSAPVTFLFIDGEPISNNREYTEEIVPDTELREALQELLGPTFGDLTGYQGELDLSGRPISDLTGLNLIAGLTSLNLSGTNITTLEKGMLPSGLTSLNLSGCESLTAIQDGAIAGITGLKTLDISNCAALETLYLNDTSKDLAITMDGTTAVKTLSLTGTAKTTFDISALTALTHFYGNNSELETLTTAEASAYAAAETFDLSGSRFDMTAGTAEGDFVRGFTEGVAVYNGQRPVIYFAEIPESLKVTQEKRGTLRTMDYFEAYYENAKTVRGTLIADMTDLTWVAEDYDLQGKASVPEKVYAEIFDEEGNQVNLPDDAELPEVDTETNVALDARVLGGSGQNNGEEYTKLFDGSTDTKWCTSGYSGWAAFALPEAEEIGKWISYHAQSIGEPAAYNTEDFELQVLNTEAIGMTEEEFLASDSATSYSVLANNANWITIDHVTENTAQTVERNMESPVAAQVYRLKINRSINGNQYEAIRFHELEMYRADPTPKDYEGILKLDNTGTFTVNFVKNAKTLATMDVIVREAVDKTFLQKTYDYAAAQDISDLIDSVKAYYEQALAEAEAVLNNEDATNADVSAALDKLFNAVWMLDFVKGDKTNLKMLIDMADEMVLNADKYVQTNWQQLLDALEAAKAVYEDGDAMDQDIQPVAEELLNAILAQRFKADKSNLEELINKASTIDVTLYTAASVKVFNAALEAANLVLEDETLSEEDQNTVDQAAKELSDAINGLEKLSADDTDTSDESKDENKNDNNNNSNNSSTDSKDPNKGPATGDNTNSAAWLILAMSAAAALVVLQRKKRNAVK